MPRTEEQIKTDFVVAKATYTTEHDVVTIAYYKEKSLSKEEFNTQHKTVTNAFEAAKQAYTNEMVEAGYMEAPEEPVNVIAEIQALKDENQLLKDRLTVLEK